MASTALRLRSATRLAANGAKEIRTPDPLNAIEVRYQLRYSPEKPHPKGVG